MGICDAYRPRLLDLGISDQTLDEWHQNIVDGKLACDVHSTCKEITMLWQNSLTDTGSTQFEYNSVWLCEPVIAMSTTSILP
jgi:hypothetical protein